jgi:hypothetical protein
MNPGAHALTAKLFSRASDVTAFTVTNLALRLDDAPDMIALHRRGVRMLYHKSRTAVHGRPRESDPST